MEQAFPIMISIKLASILLAGCAAAIGGDLGAVHKVYVLPMSHGLEQYLANTLTNEHVFVVVTDPKLADAVLTDHVGPGLEQKLNDLLKPASEPAEAKEGAKDEGPKGSLFEPANKLENPALTSTLGRVKGTVFLVESKSRQVLWSVYELPKNSTSKESDRIASAIVSRLKKDMGLGKK